MMSHPQNREETLRRLLEDNFMIASHCRKAVEKLTDDSIRYYIQNLAARCSQFAIELREEITFYAGKEPYIPYQPYDRNRKDTTNRNSIGVIRKILKLTKTILKNYQNALSRINEGYCREVLLRHKASLENSIFELKSIRTLLRFQDQDIGQLKEENTHS